jgi:hypothetical protein
MFHPWRCLGSLVEAPVEDGDLPTPLDETVDDLDPSRTGAAHHQCGTRAHDRFRARMVAIVEA